ncbi:MAG TPA: glycosyltransferase family 4 protein [Bosea sp. (in: a-proteobacteria)]|jgi:glycosyltransferase involved in cell wall biosynthesis|uniref:glycosyltransferase family 4 protein n=1 Tax=Bosea sp. (in: a-proteobacteria) TaxID=1871050 RepID=UPI002E12D825|nr:glycosyltransferase family 4 protein [Bosea sp. (in: a-proteobacteria)]
MRLLLACEFYYPSRGGVQEVMRQLAERFVAAGHDVTVCTSRLIERDSKIHNGVKIEEFDIAGNRANGLRGETERYVKYLKAFDGDAILIKAAQQWTFDAAWPALDEIKARKVFIPCGFSGLYVPDYKTYFEELPAILAKFDRLIFYAERYRDVDFARAHGLEQLSFLPNGASDIEFAMPPKPGIRARLGIPDDALVVATVGTPINAKGHSELAQAFARLDPKGRTLALILNGQWPLPPAPPETSCEQELGGDDNSDGADSTPPLVIANSPEAHRDPASGLSAIVSRALRMLQKYGLKAFAIRTGQWIFYRTMWVLRGLASPFLRLSHALHRKVREVVTPDRPLPPLPKTIEDYIAEASAQPDKMVIKTNLPRAELIETFFAADLFVFASNIEYSPLVLFEAGAAGLPYLTVPVGNSDEIIRWTGGGELCPADKDERGYTRVDPIVLAERIQVLLDDPERRRQLGEAGRASWRDTYNWAAIAPRYEAILRGDSGQGVEGLSGSSLAKGTS